MKTRTFVSLLALLALLSTLNPQLPASPIGTAFTDGGKVLQGDDALARLKEHGQYVSLAQAVQAARYAVETLPPAPDTEPVGACCAGNPAHGLRCWFGADGLELRPAPGQSAPWQLHLRLCGYGRERLMVAAVSDVNARQNRVELSRADGAVVEWYENHVAGLEQGFTVQRAPPGEGALRLRLEVAGDLRVELESGDTAAQFVGCDGQAVLRYSGLKVWDAAQRELAARLEVQGQQLVLVVNDQDAAYPVTIDPLITSQEAKLGPQFTGDAAVGDGFGFAVALAGNTALVGARFDDTAAGTDAGSAYVFVRSGTIWSLEAKLTAGDGAAEDQFGCSVALADDTALVGAWRDEAAAETDTGSAYVFVRSGTNWSQQAKLTAPDAAAYDLFGWSVALAGETALIGAEGDDTAAGPGAGSAYVFVRSGTSWSQQAKLEAGDGVVGDSFGSAVALAGDTALVGAYYDDTAAGANAGSAYVFLRSGTNWSQQAKLTAADAAPYDNFGSSVALAGDTALIGARLDDTTATDTGSAYVFVRSGSYWSQRAKLAASDKAADDQFGFSVALAGDTALVGAVGDDSTATNTGSAYVFVRNGTIWSQQAHFYHPSRTANDFFGNAVALGHDTALIGAWSDDTAAGTNAGSAYVFVRSGTNWTQEAKLEAGDGTGGDCFGNAVALADETALIAAGGDDTAAGENAGSVCVFVRSGTAWSQQAKLEAGDAAAGDGFGNSVALAGDTALVGASSKDTAAGVNAGRAYVFARSGTAWSQQAKLEAGDAAANDFFGKSVALAGDTALIGAYSDGTAAGADAGSAYVFVRSGTNWSLQAKLEAGDPAAYDMFGYSVALVGETALVGAFGDDTAAGTGAGSAYVFVRSGTNWSQQAKLEASDAAASDYFGGSVALAGDTALIGATGHDTAAGADAGSVYVFVRSSANWSQEAKLEASDAAASDYFGGSVALAGDTALIGAHADDAPAGTNAGSAYVFVRSGTNWSLEAKLEAGDAAAEDWFGYAVALAGDTLLVGAVRDDSPHPITGDLIPDHGSVYVFRLGTPPVITAQPLSCTNLAATTASFTVAVTGLEPLSYQWVRNDTNYLIDGGTVSGATTNALTVSGVQDSDAGSYTVIITNAVGSTNSKPATLTVVHHLPEILSVRWSGSEAVYGGTGGIAGGTYYVLASTNVAAPMTNWVPVATNVFGPGGTFNVTNAAEPGVRWQFFRLQVP